MIQIVKSPLRYPGGKSKAVKKILPLIPKDYKEFREPFVGGGSIFLSSMQLLNNNAKYIINDLNYDLYCFWKYAKQDNDRLVDKVIEIKNKFANGKELYNSLKPHNNISDFDRAVRFFILNRITFSGTVDSGGYSEQAFQKRFTDSSIDRLKRLKGILDNVIVQYGDYSNIVEKEGEDVFIYLDQPYYRQSKSKLYGHKGSLHINFDHREFADNMKKCKHKWLITLDNTPKIWDIFGFANIYEWELQYGMNNYKQKNIKKGKELFITNYKIEF